MLGFLFNPHNAILNSVVDQLNSEEEENFTSDGLFNVNGIKSLEEKRKAFMQASQCIFEDNAFLNKIEQSLTSIQENIDL